MPVTSKDRRVRLRDLQLKGMPSASLRKTGGKPPDRLE
jgi:hypothetical protein